MENNTYFYTSCLHGFGHGVYQAHENDLPSALEVCSHVKDDRNGEDASQCATGVYTEYSEGVSAYPLTAQVSQSRTCHVCIYTREHVVALLTRNYACGSVARPTLLVPHLHPTLSQYGTAYPTDLLERCLPPRVLASGMAESGGRYT